MKFTDLTGHLLTLEQTSSRIEITKILAKVFSEVSAEEADKVAYLLLGRLAPAYKGIVFNLADQMMIEIVARALGKDTLEVKQLYKKTGDLGETAQQMSQNTKSVITVEQVYNSMLSTAKITGEGSQEKRIELMSQLLQQLDRDSMRFVVRIPLGRLRLGFSDLTLLDALSWMEIGDKSGKKMLDNAYQVLPDIGLLAKSVKSKGIIKATKEVTPKLGTPVMPMLAQRIKGAEEMISKMGEVGVEPKYDGVRVCIHYKKGAVVRAFTRNLNDISEMFPELDQLENFTDASELILDAEGVGIDPQRKALLDFQTTMQRRRKHGIEDAASKIPLNFYIFDILYKDGKNLMQESYKIRRDILQKTIKQTGPFLITPSELTTDPNVIRDLYKKYLSLGLEGILVKKASSGYVPGRTGYRWVKMKQSEESIGKLSDTIDCVIMGFTQGQGKRASFGVGQFLAGVRNKEKIVSVTKVGTGLSDEQFKQLKGRLDGMIVSEKPVEYEVHKDLVPDFWVNPQIVVELAGDDITVSPKHTSGFALRFPRLVKFRDDKSKETATSVVEVKKLYELQRR